MKGLKLMIILAALVICCALAVGCTDENPTGTTADSTGTDKPAESVSGISTATESNSDVQTTKTESDTVTTVDGSDVSSNSSDVTSKPESDESDVVSDTSAPSNSTSQSSDTVESESTTVGGTTSEPATEEAITNHPDANMDLTFSKTGDGKGYSVIDLGKCKDTTVVIPAYYNDLPVIKIESNAFEGEEKIESVFIPDTVIAIGSSAFDSCFALTKITFSSKLEAIGDGAFADCGALNSVALPKSLTQVGTGIFAGCHSLQNITMNGEGAYKTEGACLIEVATDTVVAGCRRSTIPEGIKVIGEGAFARIMMLSKINVPVSVEKIEKDAFSGCAMLKSIYYAGNEAGWLAIDKETDWNKGAGSYMLYFE